MKRLMMMWVLAGMAMTGHALAAEPADPAAGDLAQTDAASDAEVPEPVRLLHVVKLEKHGFIDAEGNVLQEPRFEEIHEAFSEGLRGVCEEGKWGFMDESGVLAIPCRFDGAGPFREGLARVASDGQWGYIDATGAFAIEPRFAKAFDFDDGLARAAEDGERAEDGAMLYRFGFIDRQGKWRIKPAFAHAGVFRDGRAAINQGGRWAWGRRLFSGRWGYIDATGKVVVKPVYARAEAFSEGLAAVQRDGQWGFIDPAGKELVAPRFDRAAPFRDGLAQVRSAEGLAGCIAPTGDFVIPAEFDDIGEFEEGVAVIRKGLRYGLVNREGKVLHAPTLAQIKPFSEGVAPVRPEPEGKWGYMDRTGKMVIAPAHDFAEPFSEGLARVNQGGTSLVGQDRVHRYSGAWGYIDHSGKMIIEPAFRYATDFVDGLAVVAPVESHSWRSITPEGGEPVPLRHLRASYPQMLEGGIVFLIGYHRDSIGYYNVHLKKLIWAPQK